MSTLLSKLSQHSLPVFQVSLILSYVGGMVLDQAGHTPWGPLIVNLADKYRKNKRFFYRQEKYCWASELSSTPVLELESGNFRAIASSARQREASEQQDVAGQSREGRFRAGPSLGLAFIGQRRQVSGHFGVSRE
jgi:hypothetical protein